MAAATGTMSVPAVYGRADTADTATLDVHVERYSAGAPQGHLILLAGGPGQDAASWRGDVAAFAAMMGEDFCIYLMDHRGLGKSSRPFSRDSTEWQTRLGERMHEAGMDPAWFSISNAARDVASLARLVRANCPESRRIVLLGVSYGGLLAARAVAIRPALFDWLLLDSPSMLEGRFARDKDESFWTGCLRNRTCRKFAHSKRLIRRVYDRVARGTRRNACVRQAERAGEARIVDFLRPFLHDTIPDAGASASAESRVHPAMLVVPFVLQAYQCPDARLFARSILRKMVKLRGPLEGRGEARDGSYGAVNSFINNYIVCSEIFGFAHRRAPAQCTDDSSPVSVADQCCLYNHYREACGRLREHCYGPDEYAANPISTDRTKIVLLLGSMDLKTPPRPAHDWLSGVRAAAKIMLAFNTLGHSLLPEAPCAALLFRVIREESPLGDLRTCVRRANEQGLDWSFSEEYTFAAQWWTGLH